MLHLRSPNYAEDNKFSSTMRGLVIIRRCELGYENVILIVGSYMYYLSIASTPSYVLTALLRLENVCARGCVCMVRVCFLLRRGPYARFFRAL
jgi:hypothetical protein